MQSDAEKGSLLEGPEHSSELVAHDIRRYPSRSLVNIASLDTKRQEASISC